MIKKNLLFFVLCPVFAFGQDLIVKKNGDVIRSKVLKVGTAEVEYKKWNNQNGPIYSIEVNNILSINYENGEKETFADISTDAAQVVSNQSAPIVPTEIPVKPAEDNAKLLELYNNQTVVPKKPNLKDKQASKVVPIWGISGNSVLSDENITVSFKVMYDFPESIKSRKIIGYVVQVQNKTNKNIYIDLANSFKIDDQGQSTSYFSNRTITTNTNSGSGAGLNVGAVTGALGVGGVLGTLAGGVNVGGGSSAGTSVTESQERILVVPPHAMASLPLEKKVDEENIKEVPERFTLHDLPDGGIPVNIEEFKILYDENNSIAKNRRIITYSTTSDFSTYSRLDIELYIRAVLGAINSVWTSCSFRFNVNDHDLTATNWDYLLLSSFNDINLLKNE